VEGEQPLQRHSCLRGVCRVEQFRPWILLRSHYGWPHVNSGAVIQTSAVALRDNLRVETDYCNVAAPGGFLSFMRRWVPV
jgi:hypothetical protein